MIDIKVMDENDIHQVAAIEQEIFSVPWSKQGFLDTLHMDSVRFLLAVEAGEILGYCGIYMAADEGEITNVAVSPKRRREGIGELLLEALLRVGRKNAISRFFLEVRKSNESAILLYMKHGFKKCGERRDFYEIPKEDAYLMCREYEES